MKIAEEYMEHAKECRTLAMKMTEEHQKQQLLGMAEQWENMARERRSVVERTQENHQPRT